MSEPRAIWTVEVGEYDQSYVAAAFTTKELADQYAEGVDGHVEELTLHGRPIPKVTSWTRIAEVYPDGTVERGERDYEVDAPGPATDEPEILEDDEDNKPFDGHLQGHCGYHIYVNGIDLAAVEAEFERQIDWAIEQANGTCPGCGRTGNYKTDFGLDYEPITVHLVGGPFSGETQVEQSAAGYGPMPSGLIRLHGTLPDNLMDTYYGPIEYDEETHRWVRHHVSTKPVESR